MRFASLVPFTTLALSLAGVASAAALYDGSQQAFLNTLASRNADGRATEDAYGDPEYTWPEPDPTLPLDSLPDARPAVHQRRFRSRLVEAEIRRITDKIADPAVKRIFTNAYPNSLDTTVGWTDLQLNNPDSATAFPRAFIITGDILAAWLRDSSNQIFTYLPLLQSPPEPYAVGDKDWLKLYRLALGLLYQQSQQVITYPLANSFGPPKSATITNKKNPAVGDGDDADWVQPPVPGSKGHYLPQPPNNYTKVEGNDGVYLWETKWEVDSLAAHLRLPSLLAEYANRTDFLDNETWQRGVRMAIDTLRAQQRGSREEHAAYEASNSTTLLPPNITERSEWAQRFGSVQGGVYRFQREARSATETKADLGWGEPARRNGLVKSGFRPSDDATTLPHLIPSNAQLAVALEKLAPLLDNTTAMSDVAANARSFAADIRAAIAQEAVLPNRLAGGQDIYAFEVDGYGSAYFMDDANVPSLLSLPYLGYVDASDETYQRTRSFVLSQDTSKWFYSGADFSGIGGPHVGTNYAWPMSRIMQILTTTNADEQLQALSLLRNTTAGTGLIHESINVHNATDFTRPWFGWANGLFGEAIRHIDQTNPDLLQHTF
jgi:meiotically up-regulated gene 157 (Mug157) protein